MYDVKGNMYVVVSASDRNPMTSPDKTRASLEEKGATLSNFDAYFGNYSVDDELPEDGHLRALRPIGVDLFVDGLKLGKCQVQEWRRLSLVQATA